MQGTIKPIEIADMIKGAIHREEIKLNEPNDIKLAVLKNPIVASGIFTPEEIKEIEHHVGSEFVVVSEKSSKIVKDVEPWLFGEREENISWKYWDRFTKYLVGQKGFPRNVVNRLNEDTRDILDLAGDPFVEGQWKRSGLVMGHVQSGKTTNYSGLICRGIDAGYKIFIVFAGITNSLRAQTQERIEEAVVGRSTKKDEYVGVSKIVRLDFPDTITTVLKDFNRVLARSTRQNLNDGNVKIFVLKKNKSTIDSLLDWLQSSHLKERITAPLMLIDDEADNASINTARNSDQMTAINKGIRSILHKFDRAVYIGYTATPFANIFIDHTNDEELEERAVSDDLFPRNFIKSLGAPDNYVGAHRMFGEHSRPLSDTVFIVDDYIDILPLKHNKDEPPFTLPGSLKNAIRMFVLFCTIQRKRSRWDKHMSMMINVSRFNDIQAKVEDLVSEYLEELGDSITMCSGLGDKAFSDQNMLDLKNSYEIGYYPDEIPYQDTKECEGIDFIDDLMPLLPKVIKAIMPKTINMQKGKLEYSDDDPQRIIAIGGLALSRGLTLEGLAISYLLRNAGASDTLMQMARWFGYRPGYENLTRLYLPEVSRDHYEAVHNSIEELREELHIMEIKKRTPLEFGLKVRNSETGIRITAANKSTATAQIMYAHSYAHKFIQVYALDSEESIRQHNFNHSLSFMESLGVPIELTKDPETNIAKKFVKWSVDGNAVFDFINAFKFSQAHTDLNTPDKGSKPPLINYIEGRLNKELSSWDVIFPSSGTDSEYQVDCGSENFRLRLSERSKCIQYKDNQNIFKTTQNSAVANPGDYHIDLSEKQVAEIEGIQKDRDMKSAAAVAEFREKPLLLIHLLSCLPKAGETISHFSDERRHFASVSILLPDTEVAVTPQVYTANSIWQLFGGSMPDPDDYDEDYDVLMTEGDF